MTRSRRRSTPPRTTPTISVVIAAYEQTLTLAWLLQSLAVQDYDGQWEIIVCDDGSSADLASVVRDAHRRFGYDVRYVYQPHDGFRASRSRNNGIRCATGQLLVFLDADMIVRPDFLSRHAEAHHHDELRLVCGCRQWVAVDDVVDRDVSLPALWTRAKKGGEAARQLEYAASSSPWMACVSCNMSVPRRPEVWFEERFVGWGGEDRELALRLNVYHHYAIHCASSIEGLHVTLPRGRLVSDPFLRNDHDGIVRFIKNRLLLRSLHPTVDVRPALEVLRRCCLDRSTNRWYAGPLRGRTNVEEVLAEAEEWLAMTGTSSLP